jgi:uncharacterized protein (TIRG00374 family)
MLVSVACFYFATRGVDWLKVRDGLAGARPGWALLLVLTGVVVLWARTLRWRILLRPVGEVPLSALWSATVIGFGAGGVLPLRLGELVRPALIARKTGVKMSAALSSIVLERLFDTLIVLLCFIVVTLTQPVPPNMRRLALLLAGGLVVGLVLLRWMQQDPARAERLTARLTRPLPARVARALQDFSRSFVAGLAALSDMRTMLLLLWYSVYVWGAIALTFLLALLTLDIRVPLVPAALTVMVTVAACVSLPQAPGFIGTWQFGCVLALGFFGVPQDPAVSYSFLTQIVAISVNVGLAGIYLAREDLSLRQLVRTAEDDADIDDTRAVGS